MEEKGQVEMEEERNEQNKKNYNSREAEYIEKYSNQEDVIIEDNTIYEIDLDCYECLMKQKKRYL